jgi:uncharacterized membrane protein
MRKYPVALAAALALAATAPAAAAPSPPLAHVSCTNARIAGEAKCIARGQFCKRTARAMSDYRKYGFSCTKRDRNGRYHLQ